MQPNDVHARLRDFWHDYYGSRISPQSEVINLGTLRIGVHRFSGITRYSFAFSKTEVYAIEVATESGIVSWWCPYRGHQSVPPDYRLVELILALG